MAGLLGEHYCERTDDYGSGMIRAEARRTCADVRIFIDEGGSKKSAIRYPT